MAAHPPAPSCSGRPQARGRDLRAGDCARRRRGGRSPGGPARRSRRQRRGRAVRRRPPRPPWRPGRGAAGRVAPPCAGRSGASAPAGGRLHRVADLTRARPPGSVLAASASCWRAATLSSTASSDRGHGWAARVGGGARGHAGAVRRRCGRAERRRRRHRGRRGGRGPRRPDRRHRGPQAGRARRRGRGAGGRATVADIGLDLTAAGGIGAVDAAFARAWLPRPGRDDDKYRRGVVGVSAGSERYPGAASCAPAPRGTARPGSSATRGRRRRTSSGTGPTSSPRRRGRPTRAGCSAGWWDRVAALTTRRPQRSTRYWPATSPSCSMRTRSRSSPSGTRYSPPCATGRRPPC